MPGGVCPSWVIRAVQRMRSSRPRNPRNDSCDSGRWVLFLFSTCTMNLAGCRGHGSAGSARTQVPREWEALGTCRTRCMTVSKGIVDVDSQRNQYSAWMALLAPLKYKYKQSPVPCCHAAGVQEETLTLIETIHLPRVWQLGSIISLTLRIKGV